MSRTATYLRAQTYLLIHGVLGSRLPTYYREFLRQDRDRHYPDTGLLLGRTLEHAVTTVPHYRGLISPAEIRSDPLAALSRFPVLTRDTIRNEGVTLLSTAGNKRRWQENTSGGSTGEPVRLLQDPDHAAQTIAIRYVYSTWCGGSLGAPALYIWGSERDILEGRSSLRGRIGGRLLQRSLLNAFMLTDEAVLEILKSVAEGPPRLVVAYTQAAYEVARFASEQGISVPPQLGLIATAGTLYGFIREQLESTFGCRVANRYGSREIGDMAGECEHGGLHVLPWCCHIEVLDEGNMPVGPGEEGDIVVTGFTNRAMPLIRYRIGDRAKTPEDGDAACPCDRATQMLACVTGRTVDMFIAKDGRMIDGEYFTHLLYFRPWLRQFQVVQTRVDRVLYVLVTETEIPQSDKAEIAAKTRTVLGHSCMVDFEEVEAIQPSASGKLRYTMRAF